MEGGPKSLNAGLKLDEEGSDGDGTLEPTTKKGIDVTSKRQRL